MKRIVAFLLVAAVAQPASAAPPTDAEVFNTIRTIQIRYIELEKEDFRASKQQFREIIREGARGLDIAALTPYQTILIAPLLQSGALDDQQRRDLTTALERAADDPEHGAAALLLLHYQGGWDDPQRTHLAQFLEHPALAETMSSWFVTGAINSFALEPELMREFIDRIEPAILAIRPDSIVQAPSRPAVMRLMEALDHTDIAPQTRAQRQRIHAHLLKVARSIVSKMPPNGGTSYGNQTFQVAEAIDLVEYLEGPASKSELIGRQAPRLEFSWMRGPDAPFSTLEDLRGKVVVLDFWATWCGPCVATFPDIRELQSHYADSDVVIIGLTSIQGYHVPVGGGIISVRDDPAREMALMEQYMQDNDITWNIAFSTRSVIDPRFDVWGVPHLTIIDAEGIVRHNGLHPGGISLEEKVQLIDAILGE